MGRLLLTYGAIHLNVLLVSLFLLGNIDERLLITLQLAFLLLVVWNWKRFVKQTEDLSWKRRLLWILGSLGTMASIAVLVSLLFSESNMNQQTVMAVQNQVPTLNFVLFLINASVMEELFYREVLWERLSFPVVQLVLTSFLFVLAHHPSSPITWGIYGSLGLVLGTVRLKTDCLTSTLVHLSWNGLVFLMTFL